MTTAPNARRRTILGRMSAIAGLLLAVALAVTWPLALHLGEAIPRGILPNAVIALHGLWTTWWNADRLAHGFARYWDAPIFHPYLGTLAYSEPLPLVGMLSAPLWLAGSPPAFAYNSALLLLLLLNGLAGYRLARALGCAVEPSAASACLFVALPLVSMEIGAITLVAVFGTTLCFEGLVRFSARGEARWAAYSSAAFGAQALACQQYALLTLPFLAAAALLAVWRTGRARSVGRLALGALPAAFALALYFGAGFRILSAAGLERSPELVSALSLPAEAHWVRPSTATLAFPGRSEGIGLFPGFALTSLAALGAVVGLASRESGRRAWTLLLLGAVAFGAALALGANLNVAGFQPVLALQRFPGFGAVRAFYRFAVLEQLGLAMLAAPGIAWLWARGRARGRALAIAGVAVAVVEASTAPIALVEVPAGPAPRWAEWLREQAGVVLAHAPFPSGTPDDYERETWRMFAQIYHRKPLVNGYGSYLPQAPGRPGAYAAFMRDLSLRFPTTPLVCALGRYGATHVAIDGPWAAAHAPEISRFERHSRPVYADDEMRIYALDDPCPRGMTSSARRQAQRFAP